MTDEHLAALLRRHVGHQLRCVRATTGDLGGYQVETVALRCEDCGEAVLEAVQKLLHKKRRRSRSALLLLVALAGSGCAMAASNPHFASNPRFTQERVPLSARCYLTIVRDLRSEVCLAAYSCGRWRGSSGLAVVPREVCLP